MTSVARRMRSVAAPLLAVLLAASGAAGQGGPWKRPPVKLELATGIPCLYQKDDASATTIVGLFIVGGRGAVPAGLDGLAAMSTRLLLEIPDEGKVQDLMAQATRLRYLVLEDASVLLVECLSENLDAALRIAGKLIQDPLITGLRIGRARDLMLANAKMEADDAVSAARAAAHRGFFGAAGYGSALYGTEASLKAIERKDILAFVRRAVVRPNLFFVVETDLDEGPVRRMLEAAFAAVPDGAAAPPPPQAPVIPDERTIALDKDTKQTYVGRAFALPPPGPSGLAPGYLLETLLGKGPGSRLWPLRSEERLAYGVDADLTWTRGAGILIVRLETDRSKAVGAAQALDGVLAALRESGVSEDEMAATRTMARGRFLRAVEEKMPRLRLLGLFELQGFGAAAAAGFPDALAAVTAADLNAYIREALDPERALRLTVGPATPPDKEDARARIE